MSIVTIWCKILRIRCVFAAAAAGLIVLFCYAPSWGHVARPHQESAAILVPDRIDTAIRGCDFLSKKGKKWQDLSPEEKEQLRKKYQEWESLSPEEKEKIRRRMKRLNNMSPRERDSYRQLHKKWQHLPPDERKQLQKELDNWENLSPQEQDAIRRRFMK
ncbi:MAG: DUF3106 domain-containing protein [Desulfobacteraceae bacterium]|jgi:hypothetical protein|nr:DUF3106 domain-containing protein [Desulfobacteraceae bacterium]